MVVNEFLMRLRAEGYLVILAHHAGKNGTQRGRTDNDDPLDLAIQLNALKGFDPGCGALGFELAFEKVRYGDRLKPFAATYSIGTGWQLVERAADKATADREAKIPEARRLRESGMSIRKIADELGVSFGTVQGWLKRDQN